MSAQASEHLVFCTSCHNSPFTDDLYCGSCYGHVHSKFESRVKDILLLKKEIAELKKTIKKRDAEIFDLVQAKFEFAEHRT